MNELAKILITLGSLFLLGLVTDELGRRTPLPRVTLLLIFGVLIGPSAFDLLPELGEEWFHSIADMALVMVGFLLGEKMTFSSLREYGRLVLWISIAEVIATAAVILVGLILIGVEIHIALLLAGIAPATAPVASADVVHELRADGRFTRTLLGIVAVDDAWGLIVFSCMLAAVQALGGEGGEFEGPEGSPLPTEGRRTPGDLLDSVPELLQSLRALIDRLGHIRLHNAVPEIGRVSDPQPSRPAPLPRRGCGLPGL